MKKIDYIITLIFAVVMVVLYFMGFCDLDIIALIFGAVVLGIILMIWHQQAKKYNDIEEEKKDLEEKFGSVQ